MRSCTVCGGQNGQDHAFCIHCGTSLQPVVSGPEFPRRRAVPQASGKVTRQIRSTEASGLEGRQKIAVISVAAIAATFIPVFFLAGGSLKALPALFLLFLPVIPGELIFLLRAGKAAARIEEFEAWVTEKGEINAGGGDRIRDRVLAPVFSCAAKALQKADRIEDRHLRAGVIVSVALYGMGFLVYVAAVVLAAALLS